MRCILKHLAKTFWNDAILRRRWDLLAEDVRELIEGIVKKTT
jgi:hypothetical protein